MSNSWDRQPGETDKAWIAFGFYLELGPKRTLNDGWDAYKAHRGLRSKRKPRSYFDWSKQHRWADRALDHDQCEIVTTATEGGDETTESLREARELAVLALPDLMNSAIELAHKGEHKFYIELCSLLGVQPAKQSSVSVRAENAQFNIDLRGADTTSLLQLATQLGDD